MTEKTMIVTVFAAQIFGRRMAFETAEFTGDAVSGSIKAIFVGVHGDTGEFCASEFFKNS